MTTKNKFYALKLSIFIIGIYIMQLWFPNLTEQFWFITTSFFQEPYRILTGVFIHSPSDYMHLLNNIFFLAVFGTMLEGKIGSKPFLWFFLGAGIAANLSAFFFYQGEAVLGASGAISGIVAFIAVVMPRHIGLFWGVPVPMWTVLLGWVLTNLAGIGAQTGVAYEAHLFGLASGVIVGVYYRAKGLVTTSSRKRETISDEQIEDWEKKYLRSDG